MADMYVNMPELLKAMKAQGLDAAIVASPDNFFYLSSVKIITQTLIRDRLALGIVTSDGATSLVVCKPEEVLTKRYTWANDVRTYIEFHESPMKAVAELLHEKGLAKAKIGIEKKFVSAAYFEDLQARVPGAKLASCDAAFERARMIKTKPEIDLMRKAAQGTDEAIGHAFKAAKAGVKEHALARVLIDSLFEAGQGDFRDMSWGVAGGPNILTTHYWAGERPLEAGDAVRINVRSTFRGYFSHLYRMGVVGAPSERQRDFYSKCRAIHYGSIDRLRPGARASELYRAAKKDMDDAGVATKGAHVGHSTGISLHENPRLQLLDQTVLEPGMIIAAEPLIVDEGRCIYHIEDLVLVTDGAPEILSNRTNTERLLEIQ
jgi:Xaa-Pro aminopeptidase